MLRFLTNLIALFVPTFVLAITGDCGDKAAKLAHKHLYVDATYNTADKSADGEAGKIWKASMANFDKDPKAETLKLAKLVNETVHGGAYPGHEIYREAVLLLAKHSEHIVGRVRVYLPGGLGGNKEEFWKPVKAVTLELCNCGNERAIDPMRSPIAEKFIPANPPNAIVVDLNNKVFIKPAGGDDSTAFVMFEVDENGGAPVLVYLMDPKGPINVQNVMDLFSGRPAFDVGKLAGALKSREKVLGEDALAIVHAEKNGANRKSILAFTAVDLVKRTVSFVPADGTEVWTEPKEKPKEKK